MTVKRRKCKYKGCSFYDPKAKVFCCAACSSDAYDNDRLAKEHKDFVENLLKKSTGFTFKNKALRAYYWGNSKLIPRYFLRTATVSDIPLEHVKPFALMIYNRRMNRCTQDLRRAFAEYYNHSTFQNLTVSEMHEKFLRNKTVMRAAFMNVRLNTLIKWAKAIEIINGSRRLNDL